MQDYQSDISSKKPIQQDQNGLKNRILPRKILLNQEDDDIIAENQINANIQSDEDDGNATRSDEGLLNDKKVITQNFSYNISLEKGSSKAPCLLQFQKMVWLSRFAGKAQNCNERPN